MQAPTQPYFDPHAGLRMVSQRRELYESLLADALAYWEAGGDFAHLLEPPTDGEVLSARAERAHRAAGACRLCGMLALADQLSALCQACDAADGARAHAISSAVPDALRITRDRIRAWLLL